jgi:hypothetical protein
LFSRRDTGMIHLPLERLITGSPTCGARAAWCGGR